MTASEGGQPPGLGLRQAKLRQMLDGGAYLVATDIQKMGGTSYDKKNFFTFLGGMPYFVSGSAAASYTVRTPPPARYWTPTACRSQAGTIGSTRSTAGSTPATPADPRCQKRKSKAAGAGSTGRANTGTP